MLGIFFFVCCLFLPVADARIFDQVGVNECLQSQLERFGVENSTKNIHAELTAICKDSETFSRCLVKNQNKNPMLKQQMDFYQVTRVFDQLCQNELKDAKEFTHCFQPTNASQQCDSAYRKKIATDEATRCRNAVTFFSCLADVRGKCHPEAGKVIEGFQNALLSESCKSREKVNSKRGLLLSEDEKDKEKRKEEEKKRKAMEKKRRDKEWEKQWWEEYERLRKEMYRQWKEERDRKRKEKQKQWNEERERLNKEWDKMKKEKEKQWSEKNWREERKKYWKEKEKQKNEANERNMNIVIVTEVVLFLLILTV